MHYISSTKDRQYISTKTLSEHFTQLMTEAVCTSHYYYNVFCVLLSAFCNSFTVRV